MKDHSHGLFVWLILGLGLSGPTPRILLSMLMKRFFTILFLLAPIIGYAQSEKEAELELELRKSPSKLYGYFYNYPEEGFTKDVPPKGYKPFYISHYGRHGARRTHQESLYTTVLAELDSAHLAGMLTSFGEQVRSRIWTAYAEAEGLWGELTTLGAKQHRDIARRMVENYPQIFRQKNVRIDAVSSNVRRCIMSMAASTSQILVMNPKANLSLSTGDRYMDYLAYDSPEWHAWDADSTSWKNTLSRFEKETIHLERLLSSIFMSPDSVKDPLQFVIALRWIVANTNALELPVSFNDIFTFEELKDIWKTVNYKFYSLYGPNPNNGDVPKTDACRLLSEMISSADCHLTEDVPSADLRYGHDVYIMKLMNLLQPKGLYGETSDPDECSLVWQDFRMTPMAANVQMIYYKNRKGDILVKIQLNEKDISLPLETDIYPYYHWDAFRSYCTDLIDTWGKH